MIPPFIAPIASGLVLAILTGVLAVLIVGFRVLEMLRKRHTDARTLDGRKRGYTAAEALDALQRMGPDGRRVYLLQETTLDLLFPAAYALWFATLIALALARLHAPAWAWLACAVPFAGAAFDYVENTLVVVLLVRIGRGERPAGAARAASFATAAKWRLGQASTVLAASLWLAVVIRWLLHMR